MSNKLGRIYYKYNKFRTQDNLLLTIDWLTINVKDVFKSIKFDDHNLFEVNDLVLELLDYKTAHHSKVIKVYYLGASVATITSTSHNKIIFDDIAQVKFDNELFYSGEIKEIFYLIKNTFGIGNINISRLDIACDGVDLHKFVNDYCYRNKERGYEFKAKTQNTVHRLRCADNIVPTGGTWTDYKYHKFDSFNVSKLVKKGKDKNGQDTYKIAEKYGTYYNKLVEIETHNGAKDYIKHYFEKNGFDLEKGVYRFEMKMKSSWFASYVKENGQFDINIIFEPKLLQKLFITSTKKTFEFILKTDSNQSRCKQINIFQTFGPSFFVKVKRVVRSAIRTVKIEIKSQIKRTITGIYKDDFKMIGNSRRHAKRLIHDYELIDWFRDMFPYFLKEQERELRKMNEELDSQHIDMLNYFVRI